MNEEKLMQNEKGPVNKPTEVSALITSIILLAISSIPLIGYLGAVFSALCFSRATYFKNNFLPSNIISAAGVINLIGMILGCLSFILFIVLIYLL